MTNNINTLIRKYLSGDISDDEYQILSETIANDKNTAKHLEQMAEADDLTKRYKEYASVDTEAALQKFIEQYVNEGEGDTVKTRKVRILFPRFYRIAAVILILLVGGAFSRVVRVGERARISFRLPPVRRLSARRSVTNTMWMKDLWSSWRRLSVSPRVTTRNTG